jgi:hypothetical protein
MGPRAGPDGCEKSRTHRDSILGPSTQYRVGIPTELSRHDMYINLLAPEFFKFFLAQPVYKM